MFQTLEISFWEKRLFKAGVGVKKYSILKYYYLQTRYREYFTENLRLIFTIIFSPWFAWVQLFCMVRLCFTLSTVTSRARYCWTVKTWTCIGTRNWTARESRIRTYLIRDWFSGTKCLRNSVFLPSRSLLKSTVSKNKNKPLLSLLRLSKLVIFVEENGKFPIKWFYSILSR